MIRICVFDLDGTVLNTSFALQHCMNKTMREYRLPTIDLAHTKLFVGTGSKNFVRKTLDFNGGADRVDLEEAYRKYLGVFEKNCNYEVKPYEGMPEALRSLKKSGIRITVLSNKPQDRVEDNIFSTYGRDFFDSVYGERTGIPLKPDPTSLGMLLQEYGTAPEECMYFGDTKTDMATGTACGAVTVGVLWGFRGREELEAYHPYAILADPSEIPDLVASCR